MTTIRKDRQGQWTASDTIELPENYVLVITTSKSYRGDLTTGATVHKRSEPGVLTHAMFKDYHESLERKEVRCTEKQVALQHQRWMQQINSIKAVAMRHHGLTESTEAVAA